MIEEEVEYRRTTAGPTLVESWSWSPGGYLTTPQRRATNQPAEVCAQPSHYLSSRSLSSGVSHRFGAGVARLDLTYFRSCRIERVRQRRRLDRHPPWVQWRSSRTGLSRCCDGRHAEVDLAGDARQPQRVGPLVAQALEGPVDPLDLAQPAPGLGACPPLLQVGLQLVQTGQHLRVDMQLGAPQAGVLMRAVCPIWTPAGAELDLALVEELLELGPLLLGGRAVLLPPAA